MPDPTRTNPHDTEIPLAGRQNPTFLKRQKEQKRVERANAKRAARAQRRADKVAGKDTDATGEEDFLPGETEAEAEEEATPLDE